MVLVEAEKIDIADITGEWTAKAGAGAYDTKEGSPLPTSYTLALARVPEGREEGAGHGGRGRQQKVEARGRDADGRPEGRARRVLRRHAPLHPHALGPAPAASRMTSGRRADQ